MTFSFFLIQVTLGDKIIPNKSVLTNMGYKNE